ncbi:hypothetical protein FDG2_0284 [Candidatus Protofrankia californiensis]|uniref:Uncharacterized protein n=1 Tax=Candidatus Protofrankia californiensis TaxID=1839754 RepID=A0A1C3NT89_9ACTN|nr:hypothetical protein FDG2_0284 [Candidatus Protofrankia californiensis]
MQREILWGNLLRQIAKSRFAAGTESIIRPTERIK